MSKRREEVGGSGLRGGSVLIRGGVRRGKATGTLSAADGIVSQDARKSVVLGNREWICAFDNALERKGDSGWQIAD